MKKIILMCLFGLMLSTYLFGSVSFKNPLDFLWPTQNSSVETNYCIDDNNFEYLETITVSGKKPRLLSMISIDSKESLFITTMNRLKNEARDKYGDNVGFINTTKVEKIGFFFPVLSNIYYNELIIISADIIRFKEDSPLPIEITLTDKNILKNSSQTDGVE